MWWTGAFFLIAGLCHAQVAGDLFIESANVIDSRTGKVLSGFSVTVEGERIKSIGPAASVKPTRGARILDGRGRWVVPGMIDSHSHFGNADALRRYLAMGVTTVYSMPASYVGYPARVTGVEAACDRPNAAGARIRHSMLFASGFPDTVWPGLLPWTKPDGADAARQAVQDAARRGSSTSRSSSTMAAGMTHLPFRDSGGRCSRA